MGVERHKKAFWLAVVVLVVLHMNFHHGAEGSLWGGWIPRDIAYHLLWMAAATAVVLYMTVYVWPADNE